MKGAVIFLSTIFFVTAVSTETKSQPVLQSFSLQQVRLLPGVFKDAQQTDLKYILSLDADRLLAPYQKAAGLDTLKTNYGNWENTGLDGHIGGHYLSALSYMYASTGDVRINERLEYMLSKLKKCQDKTGTGYLGGMPGGITMWKDIEQGKITSDDFALNGKWVPLYNLHKTLAGLRDAYVVANKRVAKDMLIPLVNFIYAATLKLSDEQIQTMLVSEHGSLNEIFADVYAMTGEKKYLTLARRFSHHKLLEPLSQGIDNLTGLHANMQIPKAIGFKRIAEVGGDKEYLAAAQFFWQTVVKNRTVVIGGNSTSEHFHPINDFSSMITDIAGPETCNTYNMLKLTKSLFQTSENLSYIDYYERALYNHILSSQHPVQGGFVYYTPMRPQHYRVYSQSQLCMWCCVGSGMENHGKYGELIYSHTANDVFVNLFIPSRLSWLSKGVILSQQTHFPDEETTQLIVEQAKGDFFAINIRYPNWVERDALKININGKEIPVDAKPDTYINLRRRWKKGDKINITLPMRVTTEGLPDGSNYVAFLHGPIVLAAKTDTTDLYKIFGDGEQFAGYRARGRMFSLDSMPVLKSSESNLADYLKPVNGKPQTFKATDLISPDTYKDLELIPFYKLHDARYIIYWQKKQ